MNYCVDYTYLHCGTIHVDANSKEEAEAIVKKMWETDLNIINADEEHIDEDTFEVVDVQPEEKRKYRITVQETRTYEDDIYALDYDSAISEANKLDKNRNCTLVRRVFANLEDEEKEE